MLDDLKIDDLPDEMYKYVITRTYIEVKDMDLFRKKLLYAMPKVSLKVLRPEKGQATNNVPALYNRFYTYNERDAV